MSDDQYDDSAYDYSDEDTPTSPITRPMKPQDAGTTPPRGVRTGNQPRSRRPPDPYDNDDYDNEATPARPARPAPRPQAPPPSRRRTPPPQEYYDDPAPRSRSRVPRPQPDRRRSGLYLPWWSLLIMLVFVGCIAVGALLVVNNMEISTGVRDASPVLIVVTSTFTAGPPASPTSISLPATLTPSPQLPTIPPTASLPPGDFAVGKIVEVVGVGDSGLNVHSGAGVNAPVNFRAKEGDRFVIQGGPQTLDGSEWWQIQDQNNPTTRSGWASRNYLQSVTTPTPPPTVTPKS
jgi:hypothetical protein